MPRQVVFDRLRVSEIEKLIKHKYGAHGVDTDEESELWVRAVAPHLIALPSSPVGQDRVTLPEATRRLVGWANRFAPKIFDEVPIAWWDQFRERPPRRMKADVLGQRLKVTRADIDQLGLTTINGVDWTSKQRKTARKAKAKEWARQRRLAEGRRPLTDAATRTRPWIQDGYKNRRTWERHGKRPRVATVYATELGSKPANVATVCALETTSLKASAHGLATFPLRRADSHVGCPSGEDNASTIRTGSRSARTGTATRVVGAGVHAHGTKTRPVEASRKVAPPHSEGAIIAKPSSRALRLERKQLDLLAWSPPPGFDDALAGYESGLMPTDVVVTVRDGYRRLGLTQEAFADGIGVARCTLANAFSGRYGLSAPVVSQIKNRLQDWSDAAA